MTIQVEIKGEGQGDSTVHHAKVTNNGELVTGSLVYSEPYYAELAEPATVYNVVDARNTERFIVVGMLIGADRNVTTDCSVHVYEADDPAGTSVKDILRIDLNRGQHTYLNLINLSTEPARYINATTDDDDVDVTIFGYYVPNA
jgi:hypothetical protein